MRRTARPGRDLRATRLGRARRVLRLTAISTEAQLREALDKLPIWEEGTAAVWRGVLYSQAREGAEPKPVAPCSLSQDFANATIRAWIDHHEEN